MSSRRRPPCQWLRRQALPLHLAAMQRRSKGCSSPEDRGVQPPQPVDLGVQLPRAVRNGRRASIRGGWCHLNREGRIQGQSSLNVQVSLQHGVRWRAVQQDPHAVQHHTQDASRRCILDTDDRPRDQKSHPVLRPSLAAVPHDHTDPTRSLST